MADEEFDDNTKHEDEDVYNEENLEELEESDEILWKDMTRLRRI